MASFARALGCGREANVIQLDRKIGCVFERQPCPLRHRELEEYTRREVEVTSQAARM